LETLPRLALSVRQPWAHGIIIFSKDIENRSWAVNSPSRRFRGRVAIHASAGMTRDEYDDARGFMRMHGFDCPPARDLRYGGIIGSVTVIDCVKSHDSPWFMGPIGLVLKDPVPCEFIPCRGSLGFFEWFRDDRYRPEMPKWMQAASDPQPQSLL
jgi:hypothetical protein